MKILLLIGAILIAWNFTDFDSDSVLFCALAPLLLMGLVTLVIAECIHEFGFSNDGSSDDDGDFD